MAVKHPREHRSGLYDNVIQLHLSTHSLGAPAEQALSPALNAMSGTHTQSVDE